MFPLRVLSIQRLAQALGRTHDGIVGSQQSRGDDRADFAVEFAPEFHIVWLSGIDFTE